jgi:phosphatidylglycerol:prolipoprotein diacylglycerol transferase
VSGPLIPYVTIPELPLSFLLHIPVLGDLFDRAHPPSIKPFGTLVALGVYIGSIVATRHAKERGLSLKKMNEFIFWVVGLGFVGGHVLDAIFYHPDHVAKNPLYLFTLWEGLSSYGGFIGALLGALAYRHYKKRKILSYCEAVCSAFPLAWVFGRAGCAVVHDHPGRLSTAWYAVQYPNLAAGFGRFDLGLVECVLTIPLAIAYAILWGRGRKADGFFIGWMCVAYAPVRFFLDFLRESESSAADPRYGGLTPAQWACFGLLALGVYFVRKSYRTPVTNERGDVNNTEDSEEEEDEGEKVEAPAAAIERAEAEVAERPRKRKKKRRAPPASEASE